MSSLEGEAESTMRKRHRGFPLISDHSIPPGDDDRNLATGKQVEDQTNPKSALTKSKPRHLPLDITTNVLSRMKGQTLVKLRVACKEWYSLTRDPYFINLHLSHSARSAPPGFILFFQDENREGNQRYNFLSLDHSFQTQYYLTRDSDAVLTTPPCNGLICLYDFQLNTKLCNPTTGEFLNLPRPTPNSVKAKSGFPKCSFGFNPSTNEYKVVRFFYRKMDHLTHSYDLGCEIFTLGKGYWRCIGLIAWYPTGPGINVNGLIYWTVGANTVLKDKIMVLDLTNEKFRSISLPEIASIYIENDESMHLVQLEGNLCVVYTRFHLSASLDIWVLKDCMGNEWAHKLHVRLLPSMGDQRDLIEVIMINGGKIVLKSGRVFYIYECQSGKLRKVYTAQHRGGNTKAFAFVQSLICLTN